MFLRCLPIFDLFFWVNLVKTGANIGMTGLPNSAEMTTFSGHYELYGLMTENGGRFGFCPKWSKIIGCLQVVKQVSKVTSTTKAFQGHEIDECSMVFH